MGITVPAGCVPVTLDAPGRDAHPFPEHPFESVTGSIEASLDAIEALGARRATLLARKIESEDQVVHRIGRSWAAGELSMIELVDAYYAYRAVAESGYGARWDAAVSVTHKRIALAVRHNAVAPNGPDGSWQGPMGATCVPSDSPAPMSGASVVYVLFDDDNEACYVGSTKHFRARMRQHHGAGRRFASWAAYPCRDREHAYQREGQMLRDVMPYGNKRAGR